MNKYDFKKEKHKRKNIIRGKTPIYDNHRQSFSIPLKLQYAIN